MMILTTWTKRIAPAAALVMTLAGVSLGQAAEAAPGTAKSSGAIRIGVVKPEAQMGQGNSGTDVAQPFRMLLVQSLSGPLVELVTLDSMIGIQIDAEARQKGCDYVLHSKITQKIPRKGGLFSALAPVAVNTVPMAGAAGSAAAYEAAVISSSVVQAATEVNSTVKAKSTVEVSYKLMRVGATAPMIEKTVSAKAKTDGEDVVAPLLRQAAEDILTKAASAPQAPASPSASIKRADPATKPRVVMATEIRNA
jgi:hypothetical protein